MGLRFANPIGLAAGLDKSAEFIDALGALGFGFLELGSVSPKARLGNPKPRVFRLPAYNALINRIGLKNCGVEDFTKRLQKRNYQGVVGVNITKNENTSAVDALADYLHCFEIVYPHADYVTLNVSCPHEAELRHLQLGEGLDVLLKGMKQKQHELSEQYTKYVPLVIKISPDLSDSEIEQISQQLLKTQSRWCDCYEHHKSSRRLRRRKTCRSTWRLEWRAIV